MEILEHVSYYKNNLNEKKISLHAWTSREVSWSLRLPEFTDKRHMIVVSLSTLGTGRLYPPGISLVLISVGDGVDPSFTVRLEGLCL